MFKCVNCQRTLAGQQRKYCSARCKMQAHQTNSYQSQQTRAYKRKLELVEAKGGKCQTCGYSKNLAALSFHHRDPSEKSFGIDARNISNRSMAAVLLEAEKCDLLCMNCHAEVHNPQFDV